MRRWLLLCAFASAAQVVACSDGTGGAGGSGGGGGAGAGGALGCVDIYVDAARLPGPPEYAFNSSALAGGFHRTESSVLVAWMASQFLPAGDVHERLALEEYSLADGSSTGQSVSDAFDASLTSNQGNLSMAARSDTGAALVASYTKADGLRFRVLDGAGATYPDVPSPFLDDLPTWPVWDGEAFAVHAHGSGPPRPFTVARFGLDGSLLLPPTQYGHGASACACPAGYALSTDPIGGRTWLVDPLANNYVSAHERDGTPIFDPPLELGGSPNANFITNTALEAYPGGADFTWLEGDGYSQWVLRVDDVGAPVFGPQKVNAPGDSLAFTSSAIHRMPDGRMLVVGAIKGGAVYSFVDPETGEETPAERFFDDATYADQSLTDLRYMRAWDDEHGLWVAFAETITAWRVLRLAPGCVYPSWREGHPAL